MDNDAEVVVYVIFLVVFVLVACVVVPLLAGVVIPESRAVQALSDAGYTAVQITGKDVFFVGFRGCDSGDSVVFHAKAINPIGRPVDNLIVCSGFLKGATIRTR